MVDHLRQHHNLDASADVTTQLAEAERRLLQSLRQVFRVSPVMLAGMQSFALARKLLGELASESECQVVLGGSPANPTTQMNLALFRLAQEMRTDGASSHLLQNLPAERLAQEYQQGRLPTLVQQGLARFLQEYGHQSICELDLGVPRWSEDPTYVLSLLTSYLEGEEHAFAPDRQLSRAGQAAETMIATLSERARHQHWLRGWLVRSLLQRAHELAGFREMTRFVIGLLLAQARAQLVLVGATFVQAGKLDASEEVFWLTFPELHAALAGAEVREYVSARRAIFEQELKRRQVPLVLLSDGTAPADQAKNKSGTLQAEGTLQGTPASPGKVTALARVILDPHTARLLPGEILVTPSTDPGWTPLFLQAAGLVMEVGGAMAHGEIVAREYGLPAVVGVPDATRRIRTGSRITIDGSAGTIVIEHNGEEYDQKDEKIGG
jgi:pyruvate,water dikinase